MAAHISPRDQTVIEGSRWCHKCQRAKPSEEFQYSEKCKLWSWWCKMCHRHHMRNHQRDRTPEERAKFNAYLREYDRQPHRKAAHKEYKKSMIGRLIDYRYRVRRRMRTKPTDRLRESEAALTREIERLRKERDEK